MKALIGRLGCRIFLTALVCGLLVVAGCSDYSSQYDAVSSKLAAKEKENATLQQTVDTLTKENSQCQQQVRTLQGLTAEQKTESIPTVSDVTIAKRTGIYNAETADRETRLVIYFRPIDETGDAIKASGAVHIELWDLDLEPAKAVLVMWNISAGELKKTWSGSLLADFYRLAFTVPEDYATRKNLTLKLTFTDYFTGKTFSGQMAVVGK
jgi:outer membrane murein-binding lipoprotein Lpp